MISRTSSGDYYPIFNQSCTDRDGAEYRVDLHVDTPERISLKQPGEARSIPYRHCPAQAPAPTPRNTPDTTETDR